MGEPEPTPYRSSADATAASAATSAGGEAVPTPDATTVALENQTPARTIWANLNHPFVIGFFLTFGGLVAFALGMAITSLVTIWIYIAFAMFAALGLDPLVRRLQARGMKRAWAITVVYFVFALVIIAILWLIVRTVIQQIAQFIRDLPGMIGDFQRSDLFAWLVTQFGDQAPDLLAELQKFLTDPNNVAAIGGGVLSIGLSIGTTISGIIIIVLSLYFLASLPEIKQAFYRLWPARLRSTTTEITEQITESVGGYLGGMVVLAFFNSLVAFLLYLLLGLPFPALMAVVAFSVTLIPLVGGVLFWAIGTVVALIASPIGGLVFAIVYLVYMQIEAYVLTPKVMNKAISVPGSLVVIGALVGGTLMGLLGALVAIPVTASILLIIKKVYIPKQDAAV
ncbi:AI-2E family transporter [Microbacterium lacticum]|uniref:AI-2E family transporter n=1 Tax=Microbacterium lacticum TaxID=33885 RepID=UPI0018B09BA0|nr:AI-2E family transporter [Microbacterium lacticum]MBF9335556.1 AI-2E family transporter [Microbacterium lacticum]